MARGEARYRLVLETDSFTKGISAAEEQLKKFGQTIASGVGLGAGIEIGEKLAHAMLEVVPAMAEVIAKSAEYAEHLEKLSTITGVNVETIQKWGLAAREAHVDMDMIAKGAAIMEKKLQENDDVFQRLGLSVKKLKQEDPGQVFEEVMQKVASLGTQYEKVDALQTMFGKSGATAWLPLLAAMKGIDERARELNTTLGEDEVRALDELQKKLDDAGAAWDGFKNHLAALIVQNPDFIQGVDDVVSALGRLSKWMTDNKQLFNEWVENFKTIVKVLSGGGLVGAGEAFGGGGNSISGFASLGGADIGPPVPGVLAPKVDKEAIAEAKRAYMEMLRDIHTAWKMTDEEQKKEDKAVLEAFKKAEHERLAIRKATAAEELDVLEKTAKAEEEAWRSLFETLRNWHDQNKQEDEDRKKSALELANTFQIVGASLDALGGLFVALGGKADSFFAQTIDGFARMADAAASFAAALASDNIPGMISSGASFLGALFGLGNNDAQTRAQAAARKQEQDDMKRMMDAAKAQRASGISGIEQYGPAYFASHPILTPEDAARQGAIFAAAWGAVVKEKGIVEAAAAFKDAFAKMKADMEAGGISAPAGFAEIGSLIELGLDEKFKAIASAANDAAKFLRALADAGVVGPELISAFEEEARRAFAAARDRALDMGKDPSEATKAGFAAANPLLKELLNQSILSKTTLDKDIQDMIDASGIVPDVSYQQLDELRHIRAAVEALAGMHEGNPTKEPKEPPVDPVTGEPLPGHPGKPPKPQFALGGFVNKTGYALVHQGEYVIPAGAGAPHVSVHVQIGEQEVRGIVAEAMIREMYGNGAAVSYLKRAVTGKP